jgi:hypothetical protein
MGSPDDKDGLPARVNLIWADAAVARHWLQLRHGPPATVES